MYTLPCIKQTASGRLLYSAGSTLMGGMGARKRERIYVYIWLIHFIVSAETNVTL